MANFNINPNDKNIAIPPSKLKTVLLLLGAFGFVALGLWFITNPEMLSDNYRPRPKWEIVGIGYASVIFFGACFVAGVYFLISNKPRVVIDDKGIAIAKPFGSTDLVKWSEIKDFKTGAYNNVAFIYIYLNNTDKFISHQKSAWSRKNDEFYK